MSVTVEDAWCQLYSVQVLRKEPLNIENRIGHAYPTSLYRLVYDRVAESHFAFSESGYFRKSRWAGNYEVIVAGKGYVTRYGDG